MNQLKKGSASGWNEELDHDRSFAAGYSYAIQKWRPTNHWQNKKRWQCELQCKKSKLVAFRKEIHLKKGTAGFVQGNNKCFVNGNVTLHKFKKMEVVNLTSCNFGEARISCACM